MTATIDLRQKSWSSISRADCILINVSQNANLFDQVINGQCVQIFDDHEENEPISKLLKRIQGLGLKNCFHLDPFHWIAALLKKKKEKIVKKNHDFRKPRFRRGAQKLRFF